MGFRDVYQRSLAEPEAFWMEQAERIDWVRKPSKALFDDKAPLYEWFSDGLVNTCWNAVGPPCRSRTRRAGRNHP